MRECSICGATGVNKITCPDNPHASNPHPQKHLCKSRVPAPRDGGSKPKIGSCRPRVTAKLPKLVLFKPSGPSKPSKSGPSGPPIPQPIMPPITPTEADKEVFVIVPGAGTYDNRAVYDTIPHIKIGYSCMRTPPDVYPKRWRNNDDVSAEGPIVDLATQAQYFQQRMDEFGAPKVVVCGSRGGQVTVGKVWKTMWRGPTIIINAGVLQTVQEIPKEVTPYFVTFGKDYFFGFKRNQSLARVKLNTLARKAVASGLPYYFIHFPKEEHMPNWEAHGTFLADLIQAVKNGEDVSKFASNLIQVTGGVGTR